MRPQFFVFSFFVFRVSLCWELRVNSRRAEFAFAGRQD
jgi:hypothetical protein